MSIVEQISELKREIALRRRCYPKWVAAGRMTQEQSETRLGTMLSVLETLERLAGNGQTTD